jgi:hypothetical protein
MARKGLPKKYAKMGFKKGWAAYKRSKRGRKRKSPARKKTYRRKRAYTAPKRRRKTMARRRKKGGSRRRSIRIGTALTIGTVALPAVTPIIDEAMKGGNEYAKAAQTGLTNAAAAIPAALSVAVMTYVARYFIKGSIPVGRYNIGF